MAATVVTSNREPVEWLGLMADALLAQSAIDRLLSAAYELVLDGESYRQHRLPTVKSDEPLDPRTPTPRSSRRRAEIPGTRSHVTDARGGPIVLAHDNWTPTRAPFARRASTAAGE